MHFNPTEQTVSWFRDRYREDTLEIKPPFQRRPVWVAKQKCYLIDTILRSLPVPEIYMQHTTSPEGKTTYAVVDGQQRIRTVLQFIGSEKDPDEQRYNKFSLDKLNSDSPWRNKAFAELTDEEKKKFYGYTFAVRFLKTDSDEEVRDMFRRLNKFLTPLNAQELRNATYTGPFIHLVEELADDEYWAENVIVTAALIRRMKDMEFVSDLLIGIMHGPQGGSRKVIDEYYNNNEDYEDEFPGQRDAEALFVRTLETVRRILPKIRDTRWKNITDFYTLFIAVATLLREGDFPRSKTSEARKALAKFAEQISRRFADERARVSNNAIDYVRAVEKGANDKKRRADRHTALLHVIRRYFRARKSTQ